MGGTLNAMIHLAARAQDLPFFVDNYKPNIGPGERKFVQIMHQVLEDGEKRRLNRTSNLKERQDIRAWPIFAGEDLPQSDAASLARLLGIEFLPAEGMNEELLRVQRSVQAMSALGVR